MATWAVAHEKPSPGLAVLCLDCDALTPISRKQDADKQDCLRCDSDAIQPVTLVACPDADNDDGCDADEHDFGVGLHIVEGIE